MFFFFLPIPIGEGIVSIVQALAGVEADVLVGVGELEGVVDALQGVVAVVQGVVPGVY